MFGFDLDEIDDLMKDLDSIEVDRIAPVMLEESVPILKKTVVRRASAHKDTGAMVRSIKQTGAQRNESGYYICVRPTGTSKNGKNGKVRNMEKMAYLEFGTSNQKASPVLSPAVRESEDAVADKMQEVFNREVDL